MFHATSTPLARLAARVRAAGLARDHHRATVYGWQVEQVALGTYRYRDPRFDRLRDRS